MSDHSTDGLTPLHSVIDVRGRLLVGEFPHQIPFEVHRFFVVSEVPEGVSRGGHAHRACHQFVVVLSGTVTIDVSHEATHRRLVLGSHDAGLHIPPGVFARQSDFSPGAIMLVLASEPYDPDDYVDWDDRDDSGGHGREPSAP